MDGFVVIYVLIFIGVLAYFGIDQARRRPTGYLKNISFILFLLIVLVVVTINLISKT